MNRRKFIVRSSILSTGVMISPKSGIISQDQLLGQTYAHPLAISTWDFGLIANSVAWECLAKGMRAVDAVEQGIRVIEADEENLSVGIGGLPDREGIVTLDACIMDEFGKAGSVTFLEDIVHPISVARLVMEKTPHVMLSGKGAQLFALENGFTRQNLLTEKSKQVWEEWKKKSEYKPVINIENHDTVGLLAMDILGNISGGCSTSGLAFKMHGRVGDSPIIGAGLYVDNEIGAAVATGLGELVMRNLSSFLVVELMRQGFSPQEACEEAITRIVLSNPGFKDYQVGIIALDKAARTGAYSLQKGFNYALRIENQNGLIASSSYL
jgi:isoaspartyl peptidase/L-asparaginase-like protein (Ntn-hydrolase superfamily)